MRWTRVASAFEGLIVLILYPCHDHGVVVVVVVVVVVSGFYGM